ncbi:signal peptidase I [Jeotgalibaca sp. MA1X17-3]|uniref:signal peptidase I n=1 Tax=Jeotgalibaca sp. MA1X17-3 TaxID=2908211 RepID=UPI001F2F78E1|nr:signal peptidase I [Jeotgalibaca sp. MA1X17-3]UJF14788.1 signal peptidase I [Jeotgalibaca sp. MA1X17-3]
MDDVDKSMQKNDGPINSKDNQNFTKKNKPPENSLLKESINILFSVLVAYILFILIRTFLFFPFQVVGESMSPTLLSGDRLILNRLATIDRFDVVVFPAPDQEDGKEKEEYVKRIIGVPGDEIVYQGDSLFINEIEVEENYLEPVKDLYPNRQTTPNFTLIDLPNSNSNVIPEGMYLVMGDNRPVSKDSREFGLIPAEAIEGNARLRIWPLDRIGFLEENE